MPDVAADRLDDLAERLDRTLRQINGSDSAAARSREQGERLRRRHSELRARGEVPTNVVEHDIKALEDAVNRWVQEVDLRFSAGTPGP